MRAIVITEPGGPEVLQIRELPDPVPAEGEVLIRVKAFGVNHAETHMRKGEWPEAAPVSGIEAVGTVVDGPRPGCWPRGRGGDDHGRAGTHPQWQLRRVRRRPGYQRGHDRHLADWADLAAIPESYATAWMSLHGNLELQAGQSLLVRGATSALGQAAVNIATDLGAP